MAFKGTQTSSRRSGFGGTQQATGGQSRPVAPDKAARGGGQDKVKSVWSTAATMYDPYHSSLEVQVVAEYFRTALCIRLSPVFAERRGPDEAGGGRKYNHDETSMVVLDLIELIVLKAQLDAFIAGELTEVVLPRLETKRLILALAETYYDESHPEYSVHANGLVLAIEEDASTRSDAKNVIFISHQQAVVLADGTEPVAFYPEIQALVVIIDSYLQNCARVDYASVRLIEGGTTATAAAAGPSATMPVRREKGGLAPATRTPAAGTVAGNVTQTSTITDDDISDALGETRSSAGKNLDDVLGDVPDF